MNGRLKILLAGMVAGDPQQGGATWAVLQYVTGLRALGHEVVLVEPVSAERLEADPRIVPYFQGLPFLEGKAAMFDEAGGGTFGLPLPRLLEFASEADLLINVSGMLRDARLLDPIPVRAFLDLDPGFNQVWHETGSDMGFDLHTHFATVGQRLGCEGCPIPTCGREWIHTLPPVSLAHWPRETAPPRIEAFTSIGHWRSYGSVEHGGIHYSQRAHSLRRLVDLPQRSPAHFQLALGIHRDEKTDLAALREHGWELADPDRVARDPRRYADYVRSSRGELCIAKGGYVDSGSGWFSDRSACYLAAGRPVVAQDTGFAGSLPVGAGLFSFSTAEEAAEAVAAIEADYDRHAAAAREIAEKHLDARLVLKRLVDALL